MEIYVGTENISIRQTLYSIFIYIWKLLIFSGRVRIFPESVIYSAYGPRIEVFYRKLEVLKWKLKYYKLFFYRHNNDAVECTELIANRSKSLEWMDNLVLKNNEIGYRKSSKYISSLRPYDRFFPKIFTKNKIVFFLSKGFTYSNFEFNCNGLWSCMGLFSCHSPTAL